MKDIEQALYVGEALKPEDIGKIYSGFPKKWKVQIKKSLEDAKPLFPLMYELIDKEYLTLQNLNNV
ncbi:hypothetical protein COY52_12770 [Candidatus Desantisbacteria bacterium CG_4_10_14_0_8_um_filter_48_22]|uniref:Uncharacterized protein n=1 Tax=Candidatus Desantisbacteria bacterium CG_4_10_14_0_8_um_filter_48_22 TaxID=1974543 RepID=A0A2M7S4C2_9BACT|nr:MAG: hypothetical protein AUJ67_06235 [Candidatus Desantisbacteria bacterium CG1_02_49_89]PIV57090.1 MAG: hypothetical protein COS16_01875 [Candidatus Desantisbacteria bacterium CG02_land_8_20_14_3_00_49_13]PIZ14390.1 MAG: hypothetical protein COY52_12770 [Candidatus Desantisbacteria bacterium CG_4_10_14_0_8_um_filter_48_22]PJB27265.1 MAG: hypothetical protein CO111_06170 [Candidatus Desantisbacteria bacterium CG_4_9_14_3_um_filter_50_7]